MMRIRRLRVNSELSGRVNERNHLSAISPVYPEIGEIRCDHWMFWMQFTHADQAQVGEVRTAVSIAARQFRYSSSVVGQNKGRLNQSGPYKVENEKRVAEVKCCLS